MTPAQDTRDLAAAPQDSHMQDQRIAYALLRLILGLNICLHGVSRLTAGAGTFAGKLVTQFAHSPLPAWSVYSFGITLPWVEAALGLLLFVGFRTRGALIGGSLLILVLTFGSALIQDWNAAGTQLTYGLVYAVLLFLRRYNAWALDDLLLSARA